MPQTVDLAFIEEYNADVHVRYQNAGFLYQSMTREGSVHGTKIHWQRFGSFTASTKPRGGDVPLQDPTHSVIEATMVDTYVGSTLDKLDELKINIEARAAHANGQFMALGREFDARLRTTIAGSSGGEIGPGAGVAIALSHLTNIEQTFMLANAPMDGNIFCAVGPRTWSKLLTIPEFVNLDYVGAENLPFAGGMTAKRWRQTMFFVDPLIAFNAGNAVETNLVWHKDAIGHGINAAPYTDIGWERLKQAFAFVSGMSTGSAVIEENGAYTWSIDTDA